MAKHKVFTVVGIYPDNDDPYVGWHIAKNAKDAVEDAKGSGDMKIVAVFKGAQNDMSHKIPPSVE